MNKLLTLSLMVALSIALPACGGGGSGGSSDEGTFQFNSISSYS